MRKLIKSIFLFIDILIACPLTSIDDTTTLFECIKTQIGCSKPVYYSVDEKKKEKVLVLRLYETGVIKIITDSECKDVEDAKLYYLSNTLKNKFKEQLTIDNTTILELFIEIVKNSDLKSVGSIVLDMRLYENYLLKINKNARDCIDSIESIREGVYSYLKMNNIVMAVSAIYTLIDKGGEDYVLFGISNDTNETCFWYNIDISPGSKIYNRFCLQSITKENLTSFYNDKEEYKKIIHSIIFCTSKRFCLNNRLYSPLLSICLKDKFIRDFFQNKNQCSLVDYDMNDELFLDKYKQVFHKNLDEIPEICSEVLRFIFSRKKFENKITEIINCKRFKETLENNLEVFGDIKMNIVRNAIKIYNKVLFNMDDPSSISEWVKEIELKNFTLDNINKDRSDLLEVLDKIKKHLLSLNRIDSKINEDLKNYIEKKFEK